MAKRRVEEEAVTLIVTGSAGAVSAVEAAFRALVSGLPSGKKPRLKRVADEGQLPVTIAYEFAARGLARRR
jgi:hypothetical protein